MYANTREDDYHDAEEALEYPQIGVSENFACMEGNEIDLPTEAIFDEIENEYHTNLAIYIKHRKLEDSEYISNLSTKYYKQFVNQIKERYSNGNYLRLLFDIKEELENFASTVKNELPGPILSEDQLTPERTFTEIIFKDFKLNKIERITYLDKKLMISDSFILRCLFQAWKDLFSGVIEVNFKVLAATYAE